MNGGERSGMGQAKKEGTNGSDRDKVQELQELSSVRSTKAYGVALSGA